MEQKTLSAEPRRSFSNEFKLQMVKLALQPRDSVACIARILSLFLHVYITAHYWL
ncbi:transposase [Escherichia coli]|uniref:transposase n=1 Tax=Escherichia coli TaxID=562 RepID=UPI000DE1BC47|nr:transposase [Escherichia coli]